MEMLGEQLLAIADDTSQDFTKGKNGEVVVDAEHIARSRLRVDTRKLLMSKLAPKKYGDATTVRGDKENPVGFVVVPLSKADERA